jgi:hypothetical protein
MMLYATDATIHFVSSDSSTIAKRRSLEILMLKVSTFIREDREANNSSKNLPLCKVSRST